MDVSGDNAVNPVHGDSLFARDTVQLETAMLCRLMFHHFPPLWWNSPSGMSRRTLISVYNSVGSCIAPQTEYRSPHVTREKGKRNSRALWQNPFVKSTWALLWTKSAIFDSFQTKTETDLFWMSQTINSWIQRAAMKFSSAIRTFLAISCLITAFIGLSGCHSSPVHCSQQKRFTEKFLQHAKSALPGLQCHRTKTPIESVQRCFKP